MGLIYEKWLEVERIFSLLTGLATGLAYVVAIAGTPYGIYHAFDRHDNAQGFISVFIPPFAWYMAVEAIGWHDDFAGVDWSQRIQNDARTAILLLSAASENDAIRADKVAAAVEEFSEKLAQYPIDKRAKVKSVVDSFLAYEEALSNDLAVEFDRELSGTGDGKFRFQSSAKTMELERLVRQHPGIDDVLKGGP